MQKGNFTEGNILRQLLGFAMPVIGAMFLQSLYGAVDLLIVGRYGQSTDVSAVSTGSQIMMTVTMVIAGLAMGTTILIGQQLGEGKKEDAGKTTGASIAFFGLLSIVLSIVMAFGAKGLASLMQAPQEAFVPTTMYIFICSCGLAFITAYNLLGALFRGLGNSRVPLFTVFVASIANVIGDYALVKVYGMGAAGAAYATVAAQLFSVLVSLVLIRQVEIPFLFSPSSIRLDLSIVKRVWSLGFPIALADFLVGISFLLILAIVNSLGLMASAGMGVAERVSGFLFLVPSAFSQSMASFVAQNFGAGKMDRAHQALRYGIACSLMIGIAMGLVSFFYGDHLCGIFSKEEEVIQNGWDYLKAYSFDCIMTSFFFTYTGYFNGCGHTKFVMAQSIIGAFGVRVPVSYLMSKIVPVSLFRVGLATPASSFVQTLLCLLYMKLVAEKKEKEASSFSAV